MHDEPIIKVKVGHYNIAIMIIQVAIGIRVSSKEGGGVCSLVSDPPQMQKRVWTHAYTKLVLLQL